MILGQTDLFAANQFFERLDNDWMSGNLSKTVVSAESVQQSPGCLPTRSTARTRSARIVNIRFKLYRRQGWLQRGVDLCDQARYLKWLYKPTQNAKPLLLKLFNRLLRNHGAYADPDTWAVSLAAFPLPVQAQRAQ